MADSASGKLCQGATAHMLSMAVTRVLELVVSDSAVHFWARNARLA